MHLLYALMLPSFRQKNLLKHTKRKLRMCASLTVIEWPREPMVMCMSSMRQFLTQVRPCVLSLHAG